MGEDDPGAKTDPDWPAGEKHDRGAPASRRERKKRATREALHEAALRLTEQMGLAGVTIEAITDQADVAQRTFFNYYSSKEDAVLGYDPLRLVAAREELKRRPQQEAPLAALRAMFVEGLLSRGISREDLMRMMRLIKSEPHLRASQAARWEEMEGAIAAVVAERCGVDPQADMYPALVVGAAVAAVRTSVMRWCDQEGETPLEDLLGQAFDRLEAGLGRA